MENGSEFLLFSRLRGRVAAVAASFHTTRVQEFFPQSGADVARILDIRQLTTIARGLLKRRAVGRLPLALLSFALAPTVFADEDSNLEVVQMQQAFQLHHTSGSEAAWLAKVRSFMYFDTMTSIEPMFGRTASAAPFSLGTPHVGSNSNPAATGMFDDPCAFFVTPARNGLLALRDDFGLRSDIHEAGIFQAASDTVPGARSSSGAARFNARFDWLLFRNEGEGVGRFTAQFRQNNVFPQHDSNLSHAVESPVYLNSLAGSTDTFLARCYYAQSFADDRVMVTVGKLNSNDYIALNMFASDETTQYIAQQFDGNDVFPIAFDYYTEGVAVQALVTDWLYVDAVVASADGATDPWMNFSFDEGVAVSAETGVVFDWRGLPGRVSFAWCGSNATEDSIFGRVEEVAWGNTYAFMAQYFVEQDLGVFFQYCWGEREIVASSTSEGGLGVTIENAFGRKGDGYGLAVGWSTPVDEELSTQGLLETYYRLQVTGSLQVSLDAQVLMPTATNEISEPTVLGAIRAVFRF